MYNLAGNAADAAQTRAETWVTQYTHTYTESLSCRQGVLGLRDLSGFARHDAAAHCAMPRAVAIQTLRVIR
eukprot:3604042-Amphidinium_carterae.1